MNTVLQSLSSPVWLRVVSTSLLQKEFMKQTGILRLTYSRAAFTVLPTFPLGIRLLQEGDYFYRIAEVEKALCDQLYTVPPLPNTKELFLHLTENLRIEESELKKLDTLKICEYSAAYHSSNIKKLCSLLRRL